MPARQTVIPAQAGIQKPRRPFMPDPSDRHSRPLPRHSRASGNLTSPTRSPFPRLRGGRPAQAGIQKPRRPSCPPVRPSFPRKRESRAPKEPSASALLLDNLNLYRRIHFRRYFIKKPLFLNRTRVNDNIMLAEFSMLGCCRLFGRDERGAVQFFIQLFYPINPNTTNRINKGIGCSFTVDRLSIGHRNDKSGCLLLLSRLARGRRGRRGRDIARRG